MEKYGPEKTPYLDTFHAVIEKVFTCFNAEKDHCFIKFVVGNTIINLLTFLNSLQSLRFF